MRCASCRWSLRPVRRGSICSIRRRRYEHRRAAPRCESALQAAALRDATPPRAVHAGAGRHGAATLGPLWGQRGGGSRKRGGPMSVRAVSRWPQMLGMAVVLGLVAFVIFGPLANLFLWAFAEKWYFPNKI